MNQIAWPKYGLRGAYVGEWGRERGRSGETYPWPEAWKKSHWSCLTLSSGVAAEMRCAVSYFSAR